MWCAACKPDRWRRRSQVRGCPRTRLTLPHLHRDREIGLPFHVSTGTGLPLTHTWCSGTGCDTLRRAAATQRSSVRSVHAHRLGQGRALAKSRRRCGRSEPGPGADVGGVSPVPAQILLLHGRNSAVSRSRNDSRLRVRLQGRLSTESPAVAKASQKGAHSALCEYSEYPWRVVKKPGRGPTLADLACRGRGTSVW